MPNRALSSLAGNVDSHHEVAVADLILVQRQVRGTVERFVREMKPDVVGLSVMTFQRHTAKKIIALIRRLNPAARIVAGGYDPSLDADAYMDNSYAPVDFIVRGEGEITFRQLLRSIENNSGFDSIAGLSYRRDGNVFHSSDRHGIRLHSSVIDMSQRQAGVHSDYYL